jgi:hypothetical protein
VLLHHCVGNTSDCHIHFIQTFNGTAGGSFTGPDHEYPSYLELLLTATDPINGLSATTSVQLYPQTVALTFHSSPLGASLSVDGFTGATPFAYSVIVGSNNSVSAPAQQALNHRAYVYTSWSDGGAQTHTVLAGNTPTTYNAVYSPIQIEASKVILPDTSSAAPALWTAGKQPAAGAPLAVLSWIASDSSHNIFVERSANGVTYTSRVRLADSSPTTPAVLVVNSSVVMLAWIGTDAAHRLNVMYDAYGAQRKITLSDTSAYAPGLAFYSGQVWLAWTGGDGGHSLNVMPLGPQGLTPGHKVTLGNFHGRSSPTLVADPIGARLLLTWSQLAAPGVITLSTSSNGVNWVVPAGLPAGQTSASAPSALGLKPTHLNSHTYYWAWTGTDSSRSLCLMYANTITSWSAPVTFNEYAMGSPALGYQGPNGSVLIAWTGTDSAHHLNIAVIRN